MDLERWEKVQHDLYVRFLDQSRLALFKGYSLRRVNVHFSFPYQDYIDGVAAQQYGTSNPNIMNNMYWKYAIVHGGSAWSLRSTLTQNLAFMSMRITTTPLQGMTLVPEWSFDRFGTSYTKLPDGRLVCIGGRHDHLFPAEFCIYNDVIVIERAPIYGEPRFQSMHAPPVLTPDDITIYGYHPRVFPLTDSHSATYVVDPITNEPSIIIIGGLGHEGASSRLWTNVYRLRLSDFSMRPLQTYGEEPKTGTQLHEAELIGSNEDLAIRITTEDEETFSLRLADMRWMV